jgi:hypothetical protein
MLLSENGAKCNTNPHPSYQWEWWGSLTLLQGPTGYCMVPHGAMTNPRTLRMLSQFTPCSTDVTCTHYLMLHLETLNQIYILKT